MTRRDGEIDTVHAIVATTVSNDLPPLIAAVERLLDINDSSAR